MEITVLLENNAINEKFEAEHGLSLYIRACGKNILFDMGQTDMFVRNAEKSGTDLSDVDIAVLSHGHYDHGGGLAAFLKLNKKAPIYINEHAFMPHFNGTGKYIGLDQTLKGSPEIIFTHSEVSICKGITLYPAAVDVTKKFSSAGLTVLDKGEFRPEDFRHEQYLEICENGKKFLFSGCSHRGITNIVKTFNPDVIIGGFHFSKLLLDEKLVEYAEYLDSFETEYYTCHCTGLEQFEFLSKRMKRLRCLKCGEKIEFTVKNS